MPDDDRIVPAAHPWAEVAIGGQLQPALVIEWAKIRDANGYYNWHARCLMWVDGDPTVSLVPAARVKRVG